MKGEELALEQSDRVDLFDSGNRNVESKFEILERLCFQDWVSFHYSASELVFFLVQQLLLHQQLLKGQVDDVSKWINASSP